MNLRASINSQYIHLKKEFKNIVVNFDSSGKDYGNQNRNSLKLFDLNGNTINVKSFKIPNLINQIAYRFFRKSKAQRSFEYANKLLELNIGTPQPIAFYEFQSFLFLKNSYYVSEQQDCDLTFRELTTNFNFPDHESIVRAFSKFTFELHEKGVHFLDHSPGNTLIKKNTQGFYDFYLVDLNRMEFIALDFDTRMKNFARLTKEEGLIKLMANEYALLSKLDEKLVFKKMSFYINQFQNEYHRKRKIKKKIKFWKHL